MRHLYIIASMLLVGFCCNTNAQVKISFDGPSELEWQVKRCYIKGTTCIVDLIVNNAANKDFTSTLYWFPDGGTTGIVAYDDEGTVYNYSSISGNFGGTDFGSSNAYNVQIPGDMTLKLRCQIKEFDEFAASIKTLKIPFYVKSASSSMYCYLQAKDIPVSRE